MTPPDASRVSEERLAELITWKPGGKTDALSASRDEWLSMASELQHLRAEVAQLKAATNLCDKHKPNGGHVAVCLYCSGIKLSAALSRIDYLCGEPNEYEVSGYDVHCDEQLVVKAVARLTEKCARADRLAECVSGGYAYDTTEAALKSYMEKA